ncbi:8-oxo-dGTPase [Bacillus sp. cl95]|nr:MULTISPECIES: nucleoside triphosphatase YtkD [unclassified Bacillus (in: firmicutes)]SFB18335.1 8-oxo-dGTP diphosphatase [Bacillus sp. UNCCL13]SFQ76131.1 8-oxo-dGTPase [Bacillus sp. cl95]
MVEFKDITGKNIVLSFQEASFKKEANHVLVMCEAEQGWVLTQHKERGWEFPGGKREPGETLQEAAIREVFEETGAILCDLKKIGEYCVSDEGYSFVKAIFWGKVEKFIQKENYLETDGPIIIPENLLDLRFEEQFSFIMKDEVVEVCLERIEKLKLQK